MKERMLALPWKRERPLFRMEYHPALELPVSSSWLWVIPNSIDNCINDSHFFFNWKHISTSLSLRLYLSRLVRNKRTGSISSYWDILAVVIMVFLRWIGLLILFCILLYFISWTSRSWRCLSLNASESDLGCDVLESAMSFFQREDNDALIEEQGFSFIPA